MCARDLGEEREMKKYSILQRYRSRGNATWYGRISGDGVLRYVSLGVRKKAEAQEWLNRMNAEKFLPASAFEERKDRVFAESVVAFLGSVETAHGSDSRTVAAYASRLSGFAKWARGEGIRTLRDLTREKAQKFAAGIRGRNAPKTAREAIRLCRQFSKWCSEVYGMEDWDPFRKVPLPKLEKRKKDFWTPEQVDRILDAAPSPGFRLFWSLMAFAGLRHAEACGFGPESMTEGGKLHVVGKGSKEAHLPVSARLSREMERFGELRPGMFQTPEFRHSRSNETLRKAVEASGVVSAGVVNHHRFRHSFASNLIRAGVNVKAVQLLMRHENVQVTLDTYSHLLQEDLQAAADALS